MDICHISKDKEDATVALGTGRRQASDPFFAPGDLACNALRKLGVFDIDDEELCHNVVASFPCSVPGCVLTFNSVFSFDIHYNSVHRYFCSQCKKRLPSPHLLDLHLSEAHDSFFLAQAERKPMYECYVEECKLKFANPTERRDHCIATHKYPHNFRFDDSSHRKPTKPPKTKKKTQKPKHAEAMSVDGGSKESFVKSDRSMETGDVVEGLAKEPAKLTGFKPFSFGRRGGRGGRGFGFQGGPRPPVPAPTLTTTFAGDMLTSLMDSEPSTT